MPPHEGLDGADVAEVALRGMGMVERRVALQGVFEGFPGAEAVGGQHLGDESVEALDHAAGLRVCRLDQAMVDGVLGAEAIDGMAAGGLALVGGAEAIGELLAVVGEYGADLERCGVGQAFEEAAGGLRDSSGRRSR